MSSYSNLRRIFPYAVILDPAAVQAAVDAIMEKTFDTFVGDLAGTSFAVTVRPPFPAQSADDRQQWCLWLSPASRDTLREANLITYDQLIDTGFTGY